MPLGSAGAMNNPLGAGIPLPGGEPHDQPEPRATSPGGAPGGLGTTAPPAPKTAGGLTSGMSFADSRKTLMQQHSRNTAFYDQTTKALKKVDLIRKGLDRLGDKQDLVTMDDVVDEAGKLVAHGIDPLALAGLLADAPQEGGGEALAGWIAGHAQTAMVGEQQLLKAQAMAAHQMGVSAIHALTAHANGQSLMQSLGGGQAPPMGNGDKGDGLNLAGGEDSQIPAPSPGDDSNALSPGSRFMRQS